MIGYFSCQLKIEENPLRIRIDSMQNGEMQKVRDYNPIDNNEVVSVYHVELGFLRGGSTIEVCDRAIKTTVGGFTQYEGIIRIIGTRRAIKLTSKKLEEMLGIKLNMDEIREKD